MTEIDPEATVGEDAVYRAAGFALERAQYFEAEVVTIVLTHGLARGQILSRAQAEKLVASRTPLSNRLKEVLSRVRTEPELTATFFEAVDRRNWLVHRFFWDMADDFKTPDGRSKMLAELREISSLLHSAHEFARLISELYLKQTGVDPDELYERIRGS